MAINFHDLGEACLGAAALVGPFLSYRAGVKKAGAAVAKHNVDTLWRVARDNMALVREIEAASEAAQAKLREEADNCREAANQLKIKLTELRGQLRTCLRRQNYLERELSHYKKEGM